MRENGCPAAAGEPTLATRMSPGGAAVAVSRHGCSGWLRLDQVERLLDYAWLDGTGPGGLDYSGYRAFLPAAGFGELTRTQRGWTRTPPDG
jgi:hypothetical protein